MTTDSETLEDLHRRLAAVESEQPRLDRHGFRVGADRPQPPAPPAPAEGSFSATVTAAQQAKAAEQKRRGSQAAEVLRKEREAEERRRLEKWHTEAPVRARAQEQLDELEPEMLATASHLANLRIQAEALRAVVDPPDKPESIT